MIKTTFAIATFLGLIVGTPLVQAEQKTEPAQTPTRKEEASKTTKKKTSPAHLRPATDADRAQAKKAAAALTPTQRKTLLDLLNKGKESELVALPSVGKKRAGYIVKARPFADVESLVDVTGIGLPGFGDIVKHVKAPSPKTAPAVKAPAKAKPKAAKKSGE